MLVMPDDGQVEGYLAKIATYDREFKKWEGRVEKILKRYRDDERSDKSGSAKFNILWSNVNTLVPAVFAKLPKPDVSRRFRDQDTVGRVAGMLLERTLTYEIDCESDYQQALKNVVFDRFIGARGQAWVRYEPRFKDAENDQDNEASEDDGFQVTEDAESEATDQILDWEHTPVDYVHWRDFGHSVARTWEEVTCVWRRVYMSRDALIERFGEEVGGKIPLDTSPEDLKKSGSGQAEGNQAAIYEIWDKSAGKAVWLSKAHAELLDSKDNPLKLTSFWPCPRPLYGTLTTDNLIPCPDFTLYQDQANELDILSDRIDGLIKALKIRGVYDASVPELSRIFTEGENNSLIPVKNWAAFVEKQGLKGAIDIVDIAPIAQALNEAYAAMDHVKGQIYEITGISDIVRGDTNANETATAQRLKSSYGNLRLKSAQEEVARFATELLQIKSQIICNFYRPETILKASAANQMQQIDQQAIPQAMQLLKDNALMTFRIDIEVDSMVQLDDAKLKQDRMEFLGAVGNFLKQASEAAQTAPQIVPLAMEMLKFGASAFKAGKALEGVIDQTAEELKQQMLQKQQQPAQPSPEQVKAQADQQSQAMQQQHEQQLEQFKAQMQQQIEAVKAQANQSSEQARMQADQQVEAARAQASIAVEHAKAQAQFQVDEANRNHEINIKSMEHGHGADLEKYKIDMEYRKAIEVAEISANATLQASQISAANQGANDGL